MKLLTLLVLLSGSTIPLHAQPDPAPTPVMPEVATLDRPGHWSGVRKVDGEPSQLWRIRVENSGRVVVSTWWIPASAPGPGTGLTLIRYKTPVEVEEGEEESGYLLRLPNKLELALVPDGRHFLMSSTDWPGQDVRLRWMEN